MTQYRGNEEGSARQYKPTFQEALPVVLSGLSTGASTEVAKIVFRDRMRKYTDPQKLEQLRQMTVDMDILLAGYLRDNPEPKPE